MWGALFDERTGLSFARVTVSSSKSVVKGRVIAQAVSRWLPTTAARVQTRVWSCGIL
jgi:hypothetical protein